MGNSVTPSRAATSSTVHPHVHGELPWEQSIHEALHGSSPRAWGTRGPATHAVGHGRFIPTCMGNSWTAPRPGVPGSVHPHVHGELTVTTSGPLHGLGSSPRAWGTLFLIDYQHQHLRFIPTCMGNSNGVTKGSADTTVHPHVHGELSWSLNGKESGIGSSPRAWGTRNRGSRRINKERFIPTCMGNSSRTGHPPAERAVHPHVHGELSQNGFVASPEAGSSPRAWGTPGFLVALPGEHRFIPTCMGNSVTSGASVHPRAVHPHVHGELLLDYAKL